MAQPSTSVSRAEVLAIPSPAYTRSWHPVSHGAIIGALDMVLETLHIGVTAERYSAASDGKRIFGAWTLDIGNGTKLQVGFRNSLDKSMALGLCSGTFVMVCSNMCFSGEFVEFRKHTSGLTGDELLMLTERAVHTVVNDGRKLLEWQNDLSKYQVNNIQKKLLTYDAMNMGIIQPKYFEKFRDDYKEELKLSGESTLYQFHAGVTRFHRDKPLFSIAAHTHDLNALCTSYSNWLPQ